MFSFEPGRSISCKTACAPSEYSNQPAHSHKQEKHGFCTDDDMIRVRALRNKPEIIYPAGTQRWANVELTHDVASTLMRRCINVICPLGIVANLATFIYFCFNARVNIREVTNAYMLALNACDDCLPLVAKDGIQQKVKDTV